MSMVYMKVWYHSTATTVRTDNCVAHHANKGFEDADDMDQDFTIFSKFGESKKGCNEPESMFRFEVPAPGTFYNGIPPPPPCIRIQRLTSNQQETTLQMVVTNITWTTSVPTGDGVATLTTSMPKKAMLG